MILDALSPFLIVVARPKSLHFLDFWRGAFGTAIMPPSNLTHFQGIRILLSVHPKRPSIPIPFGNLSFPASFRAYGTHSIPNIIHPLPTLHRCTNDCSMQNNAPRRPGGRSDLGSPKLLKRLIKLQKFHHALGYFIKLRNFSSLSPIYFITPQISSSPLDLIIL